MPILSCPVIALIILTASGEMGSSGKSKHEFSVLSFSGAVPKRLLKSEGLIVGNPLFPN